MQLVRSRVIKTFSIVALPVLTLCLSCVSGPQVPPDSLVVERSELGRPRWVDSVSEVEPASEKWFVYSKKDLLKLDLGIRQTQASGLAEHCVLLADRMRTEISFAFEQILDAQKNDKSKKVEPNDPALVAQRAEQNTAIEKILSSLSASKDCPEFVAKDVYWEAVRRLTAEGPRTTYDVYVLMRLPLIHFDEVLAMTANSLKLSGRADLEPVAEVLRGRMSNNGPQRGTNE